MEAFAQAALSTLCVMSPLQTTQWTHASSASKPEVTICPAPDWRHGL